MDAQDLKRRGFALYLIKTGKISEQCGLTESEAAWKMPKKRREIWTARGLEMVEDPT